MKLKGGVLIIGSLLWEDHLDFNGTEDLIRYSWRNRNLNMEEKKSVSLPIRYGRISRKRFNTYTMIFCNSVNSSQSIGFAVPLCETIESFDRLRNQAIEMAKAEGIYTETNKKITTSWGTVGILIKPRLKFKNPTEYDQIIEGWTELYSNYQDTFKSIDYTIPNIQPIIDRHGFMKIEWKDEFDAFDFLLATPTKPDPKRQIEVEEIVHAIIDSKRNLENKKHTDGYSEYFNRNRREGIITFQDERITEILNRSQQN